jgi:hypothetical protein
VGHSRGRTRESRRGQRQITDCVEEAVRHMTTVSRHKVTMDTGRDRFFPWCPSCVRRRLQRR